MGFLPLLDFLLLQAILLILFIFHPSLSHKHLCMIYWNVNDVIRNFMFNLHKSPKEITPEGVTFYQEGRPTQSFQVDEAKSAAEDACTLDRRIVTVSAAET